uniref:Uncharacterized protein n=1 Tax=Marseillevirus LCMAC102 TaxID=2506603 RepID=A0A481YUQ4_9VIRU|nr:MAG: hypothetical protein LCMAC102_04640 [Marseillevirus LCMAC102]
MISQNSVISNEWNKHLCKWYISAYDSGEDLGTCFDTLNDFLRFRIARLALLDLEEKKEIGYIC